MAKIKISLPYRKPLSSADSHTLLAGIVAVDITPPPGMPAAGYSVISSQCYGVRTKLKARIFYLKPKEGPPVVLVQCDLLSGSLLLHHKVAAIIAEKTDVDAASLAICGTHTHCGPGNYYENEMYNNHAANRSGLEINYLDFCSRQIADGIIAAYQNRKPAQIGTGTTEIWDVTINRSLAPYLLNENIKKLDKKPHALQAINPYIHLIRIDCLDDQDKIYKPAGLFTNFSIHPNSRPLELECLYNGDVTGFVERETEKEIKKRYQTPFTPVHGAANYTHGDCNINYLQNRVESFKDMRRLAVAIAEKTLALFYSLDDKLTSDVAIRYRAHEINMLTKNKVDHIKISKRGYVGMSLPSGARGRGRTTFFSKIPLFKPGRPKKIFTRGLQGAKRIIGGPFQKLIIPAQAMPHILFLQLIQIHDTLLIPLPWEVTQEMGRRISAKVKEAGRKAGMSGIERYIVTDTSNGYCGYLTTSEEYSLQYYEGGSNLYGPNTGQYVAAMLEKLTKEMEKKGSGGEVFANFTAALSQKEYYPPKIASSGRRRIARRARLYNGREHKESYWSFMWYDVHPSEIDFHQQLVAIEESEDGDNWHTCCLETMPVNDDGSDIAILYKKKLDRKKMGLYEARWYNPPLNDKYYRFKIFPRKNQPVFYSPAIRARRMIRG